jgi:ribonuclease HI
MKPPLADQDLPRGVAAPPDGPVEVRFDGACEELEGVRVAAYGYTVEGAGLRHEDYGLAVPPGHPRATNNVAEYVAAICALEWLARHGYHGEVRLLGDSQLVIRQLTGEYRVREEHLKAYHARLTQLAGAFRRVEPGWIPRTENARADELSKRGVELARPARPRVRSAPAPSPDDEVGPLDEER